MEPKTYNPTHGTSQTFSLARNARGRCFWLAQVLLLIALNVPAAPSSPRHVPGRILVKPRAGISETNFIGKLKHHGAVDPRLLRRLSVRLMDLPEERVDAVLAALRKDPDIEYAERDYLGEAAFVSNDPYVQSGAQWHLARVEANAAWESAIGTATVVAVLDSGVNASHPDLAGQLLPGYDFISGDNDPQDDFGHGTAVAGTVAAAGNNGIGVAGIAYGCRVLPIKVMDASGFAPYSAIAEGIRYAVDRGARVINISIVGTSPSITLQEAIDYAWDRNVLVVAAAGNNANSTVQYPAACDRVIGVSATAPDDSLTWFSSYGSFVTLAGPGENIWTTQRDGTYGAWRGTSFASPIVAGVAALIASANPTLPNSRIVSILQETATDLDAPGWDPSFGCGRVNAVEAVRVASEEPGAVDPAAHRPPAVELIAPIDATPFHAGETVSITATASAGSSEASISSVALFANGALLATRFAPPFSIDWTPVSPGEYTLTAVAVDSHGLSATSAPVAVDILESNPSPEMAPLAVTINGLGSVTPNLNGRELQVGSIYKIKAVPARGQVFAGWTGIESSSRALHFTMESNLNLMANFVPNPFPPVKGSYAGLVADTNGVTPETAGSFRVRLTKGGGFSGKLMMNGKRHRFSGRFDADGNTMVDVKRGTLPSLTLALRVDLAGGSDQVAGHIGDGAWGAELAGDRNVFDARHNPALQAGRCDFVLEQADELGADAAAGSSRISAGGRARVKGRLNDGRPFTASSALAKDGDCPFYLSLSGGTEVVIGWLNFPTAPAPAANGTVFWVKTGTNSFAATLRAASVPRF